MIQREQGRAGAYRGRSVFLLLSCAVLLLHASGASAQVVPPGCPASLGTADLIDHELGVSFCELCEAGNARIVIENPLATNQNVDFSAIVITEDLRASGLTYVPGSTSFTGDNVAAPPVVEPVVSGPDGSILTWTLAPGFILAGDPPGVSNRESLTIDFDVVRHASLSEEGLVTANRNIEAQIDLAPSCAPTETYTTDTGVEELPLREPQPRLSKGGRNVDAAQGGYSNTVYAHENDDVIWRVRVRNNGSADLQDFEFDDSIDPGNFLFDWICDDSGDALNAANGMSPAGCVNVGGVTSVSDFDVAAAFGGGANPYIVAPAGGSGFYYFVGRVTDSCTNRDNTVSGGAWGCQSEAPVGGIVTTSGGAGAGSDDDPLNTLSVESGVNVSVALTGINTGQPMGATGTVTITIANNSGGTIKGETGGLRLNHILPAEYVIDPTFTPTISMNPAYGNYDGMLDTVAWTNPAAGTVPLVTTDPALPLSNTNLDFLLTSSTVHPDFADQVHMIRHGDEVTVTFRTVLIDPTYYDLVANIDQREEESAGTPAGTDPTESFAITSRSEAWWEEYCTGTLHNEVVVENDTARPEDLDVDMVGSELLFILTGTGDPLPLTVNLTNRGGHDADDYFAYVTFGEAMVVSVPAPGCAATTNPPAMPNWTIPANLPATAAVYVCDRGAIGPGATESFTFEVVKNTAVSFDDDLTFRADVIGETTLSDTTPLWFPTPVARSDGITDRANDYTLDALRARVVGYDLLKSQAGTCTENNPPPASPDDQVQIGEECTYFIESGGWFGFQTPGFTYIAVQNIQVVDEIPDGQGYISSTDPLATSTAAIAGVTLNPPPTPLDEGFFDWTFNTVTPAERITVKDHWFRVNAATRLLNDPVDTSAAPNQHPDPSSNVLTSTFEAVFFNTLIASEEVFTLGPNTIGYPREVFRRVDLTVTEPNLTVSKEVCNETIYGVGAACSNFVALADDGDAYDTYVYRVTVTNEASSGGVARAPAYDVTVTSTTDPTDQLLVDTLTSDALDNDADALIDGLDAAGEGTITDNTLLNGTPAQVIASYTHSDDLLRIDAGDSVVLYYRVDPIDDVAPLEQLTSSASASYDSLEGASGNQTAPQGVNGDAGGARRYTSSAAQATIEIIPVATVPKQVTSTSHSALASLPDPQPVVIGEEVEFQLRTLIPVAQLRSFTIRDELPSGIRCVEAPDVDLDASPHDAAGFVPGGTITPTCTDTEVVWDFGDQTLTMGAGGGTRFDFAIDFIARTDNILANQVGQMIRNGGASTVTEVRYLDEGGGLVVIPIDEATLVVREPELSLTKVFSVADADADDLPRVTVTATNTGDSPAYNPRVLDDLTAVGLTYSGDIQGTNPPTADLLTFGGNSPLFTWASGTSIAAGGSLSFSFAVHVDGLVAPRTEFDNTIAADWTSLPGSTTALNSGGTIGLDGSATGMRNGALPNAADPLNDYEAEADATLPVPGVTLQKTDLDPAVLPEIGAHKSFELRIELPEGMTQSLGITDDLDAATVSYVLEDNASFDITYQFVGIATINGLAPDETAFTAVPADGATGDAIWTIGTVVTQSEDDLLTQAIDPAIVITYSARINNDLVTQAGSTLRNSAQLSFTNGDTGLPETMTVATAIVTSTESDLTATKVLSNVTSGKAPTDPPEFGDILQYVITVINAGDAAAYEVNVVDTIPVELSLYGSFTATVEINGSPVAGFVAAPSGAPAGPLVWGRENGDDTLDIPAGGFLELTYQLEVTTPTPDPEVIPNSVYVDWTSLDAASIYERTGNGCPTVTAPNVYCFGPAVATETTVPVPAPDPLLKENTQASAQVGESFTYRITVPATPYAFPIYDVRIHDDLVASAADLRFIDVTKISGSGAWTAVNTGTASVPVVQDATVGIDIPAGEQIVLEFTVVLEDTATNASGLAFINTAWYFFNWFDDDDSSVRPGNPGSTAPMTIVGPDTLTLEKSGPATVSIGAPGTFVLDIQNTGTGRAWNLTLNDLLPNTPTGGTCDTAPSGITAQVFEADGTTPVSAPLVNGVDFSVAFTGDPICELGVTALSTAAAIDANERFIVTYTASLDVGSSNSVALTNIAGATGWFSNDGSDPETVGDRRSYTRTLTNGTVGTLDHEDAFTTSGSLPLYRFEKTVANVTSGADPATQAQPGDTLRYRLEVENLGATPLLNFTLFDELDRLNGIAAFEPGTLTLITIPVGADSSNTSATGGTHGTGVLDIRSLDLPNTNDSLFVEFEITLASVVANGTTVGNQAELQTLGTPFALSDDPAVNGSADPLVPDDEDPTQVAIVSAPVFQVEKISTDVTGDPAVLLAGETLRYTITVKNIGDDNATDATLRDAIPVNTGYVAGSTTLNGVAVADGAGGTPPFATGLPIYAAENTTPGAMRADPAPSANNVATVEFDVVIDPGTIDGTVLSNQAFVSAVSSAVIDTPSDDPATVLPDDPTRDVVGNSPLLFASKDAALQVDAGSPGIVDPGDVLRYTIAVSNNGSVSATAASLMDSVPANTTYVADTLTLNGLPVGQPDGGSSPLVAGIAISSSDLTPPLPAAGAGILMPGEAATVQFDLAVNGAVAAGTIISNQAVVGSAELANLLTDGDGNPATPPEPTLVVVGVSQQVAITKEVAVVGGGAALAGSQLEYAVRVQNVATVAATNVVITDDLDTPIAGQLTYVPGSATMNGLAAGVSVVGSVITADYSATNGDLPVGESVVLRFRAMVDAGLAIGTDIANTGVVVWNSPSQSESATASVAVGGVPGVGAISGALWHDADFDAVQDGGEIALSGWFVDLYRNGTRVQSVAADGSGAYSMSGLEPNDQNGDEYELRFRADDAGTGTASLGAANSPYTNGPQRIGDIIVASGSNQLDLGLPIQPNGVVYGAIGRTPIAGATLTLLDGPGGTAVPSSCFDDSAQQGQVTRGDGYYKFDIDFSGACASGADYLIEVTAPGSGAVAGESAIIPPASGATTAPFSVSACPASANDAIPATAQHCEAQASESAPPISVPARSSGTRYYLNLTLADSVNPVSSQVFNNHIPLDPELDSGVGISKTTPRVNVSLGELVPYEITLINGLAADLPDLSVVDRFPAGFRYVEGSARIDGQPTEPVREGRVLTWSGLVVEGASQRSIVLLLAVGAGVSEGEFTNRAQGVSSVSGVPLTGEATATVRVVPDPDFACTDVMGKVFDDANRDGYQDEGEAGLAGVRLVTPRGLAATTDAHGRYHITCAVVPREGRGSNFVLKLDDRTLPTGYRMSTRQTQVKRATRGKALRLNFAASISRVVSLDLAGPVFEPDTVQMREQWKPRLHLLLEQLRKAPAVLRLSYVADVEEPFLVDRRLRAVKRAISDAWNEQGSEPLEIESEIFWRLGAPPDSGGMQPFWGGPWEILTSPFRKAADAIEIDPGTSVERHLPSDESYSRWAQDPALLATEHGDTLTQQEVFADAAETVKLKSVVPAIRFASGVADIPESTIDTLRVILDGMQHLDNVRLHLTGHSDDQPLSGELAKLYGDNAGLSRERSGVVAEFIQAALSLPPDAISYSWTGDAEPIASNATEGGRAQNRRVEVEVWYDEIKQKVAVEDVVIPQEIKRVKVCRMETVCKLRFREGRARRARVKNLIAPLRYTDENVKVPRDFVLQVERALHNLRDKQNVTVKFMGYTDDSLLSSRDNRIYGTHLAVSKARAHRVALVIKEELGLSTSAIASDGRGATRSVASNDEPLGRALNRRIEVEFWYDDPLQELADEPQLCPATGEAELVTRVYEPTWARIAPIRIEGGDASIPAGYADDLSRALSEMVGKQNLRLRFVGYTANERLDRRTALAYGDEIGLSAARARRTMEAIQARLGLEDSQVEHEGRGYLYSNDVVNGGFIQGDTSQVAVQVVYDEAAVLDDYEGVAITPITRELRAKSPLELNLMRISVDGEPIDDPGRSHADIARCTDVALEQADVRFRFDALNADRRLSVTSESGSVAVPGSAGASVATATARFRMYSNYPHFIERAEVRIFEATDSLRAEPLSVVEVGADGFAQWQPSPEHRTSPKRELEFVLRAYDGEGHFDETAPQSLWLVSGEGSLPDSLNGGSDGDPLLAGYGESGPLLTNIPLDSAGSVTIHGSGVPARHGVWVAGNPVPVDENGEFVAEAILPSGLHTVEVNVLDEEGNGELFLRDLELKKSDWFYVGIADVTFSESTSSGPKKSLDGQNAPYEKDSWADGRLAFFLTGKFAEDWALTASADTREDSIGNLFSNFMDKSPEALFRRIDPDYYSPTFGDDGTVEELAPTSGKFFVRLNKKESHALWGNFGIGYRQNELALVERGLYGGNVHHESQATTSFGEKRLMLDGFAADPGTVASRDEFRGTGGSLYYLRNHDILNGSERLRVELRDKDSGLVSGVVDLRPGLDYDIDYFQGRVLLTEPMSSTAADELLVRSDGMSGYQTWLVVQYEYTPGFEELDTLAVGGQGHYWFGDLLKLGFTASRSDDDNAESSLYAADATLRRSSESWLKLQLGRSEGQVSTASHSDDGGFDFVSTPQAAGEKEDALGYRVDLSVGFADVLVGARGRLNLYAQLLDAGYTAPGLVTLTDTEQFGGMLEMPVADLLRIRAKADRRSEDAGLETTTAEVDVEVPLSEQWSLSAGVRYDDREDNSPVVPETQEEGVRTDVVAQVEYDPQSTWRAYAFGQATVAATGDREDNERGGVGGELMVTKRLSVEGEVSHGSLGPAALVGSTFQKSERTAMYVNYALEDERAANGVHARKGNLIGGVKSRVSDSASVFVESRYEHSKAETGLTRAFGMDLAPTDRWSLTGNIENGTLEDRRTSVETDRTAVSATVSYRFDSVLASSGMEYRLDETERSTGGSEDKTTWLFRNSLKLQLTPDWRLLAKFNHALSGKSFENFFEGDYTEAVLGYAYRPVSNDRLNALLKYTYFYNSKAADQVSAAGSTADSFIQKSHIAALDVTYDLTRIWTLGGKYAYRSSQVSLDLEDPDFFRNDAHLYILRSDLRLFEHWEGSAEGRMLDMPDLDERRSGALVSLYRYFGEHFKAGVGYNFTDFSDDLTDLSFDDHGWFFNMVGTF